MSTLAAELILPLLPPYLGTLRRIVSYVDNSRKYTLKPGTDIPFSGMFQQIPPIKWQVNEQGLRGTAAVPACSQRFRIASYGDSETFGWSVALEDTFQKRMETLDAGIEVLNFGVPGYNAQNIADYVEETLATYTPDYVIYLVNKNDMDDAHYVMPSVLTSELLTRARLLYETVMTSAERHAARRSPARLRFLADQLDRIARYTSARGVPVLFVFMKSRTQEGARAYAAPGGFVASANTDGVTGVASIESAEARMIVVEDLLEPFPELDDHLSPDAHHALALRLCAEIAGGEQRGCVPTALPSGRLAYSRADSSWRAARISSVSKPLVNLW